MCGIFALLNSSCSKFTDKFIQDQFIKGNSRGPEYSILKRIHINAVFGFHRLAINGLNTVSNQPITLGNMSVICNGEIYNYKELYAMMPDVEPQTDSDCEVILHLYARYGIEQTLQMLDGVFAFIICDYSVEDGKSNMIVARDPYGVRPLYVLKQMRPEVTVTSTSAITIDNLDQFLEPMVGYASEIKMLNEFVAANPSQYKIVHFTPGTYAIYSLPFKAIPFWSLEMEYMPYHMPGFTSTMLHEQKDADIYTNIQQFLGRAVEKRVLVTDRPIACLLSGGLDSSLVTALVNEYHHNISDEPLETYSIGLEGSEDLRCAKIVADYLGTNHHEIVVTEEAFFDIIPEVIMSIESFDTTTIRASLGNYLLGKYISRNSKAKVIFNGDGSDELCGGYLYMSKAPDMLEFDCECRRLLKEIHLFDVLRSDKCIASHGLEPRCPFLDRSWVQYYLSIPVQKRFHPGNPGQCEKFLLRTAFSKELYKNSKGLPLLPDEILWRKKEAFSDGVSKTTRSLFTIIQEYLDKIEPIPAPNLKKWLLEPYTSPDTPEKQYYRSIYETFYPGITRVVPYYWMPKYIEASDPSARTLDIYNGEDSENSNKVVEEDDEEEL